MTVRLLGSLEKNFQGFHVFDYRSGASAAEIDERKIMSRHSCGEDVTRQLERNDADAGHHRPCVGGDMNSRLAHKSDRRRHHRPCVGGEMNSRLAHKSDGHRHHRPCVGGAMNSLLATTSTGAAPTDLVSVER